MGRSRPGRRRHGFGGGPPRRPQRGLPFAGIPPELQARVEQIARGRARAPDEHVHVQPGRAATAGRSRCAASSRPHWAALLGAFVLVVLETVAMQAGPLLTQIGIDHGIRAERHARRSSWSPSLYFVAVLVSSVAGVRARIA